METPSLLDRIGGDVVLRRIVEHFYAQMDSLPEAATIRAMHAPDLSEAREKLFDFLSGWLGGPQRYVEKHGHPRLRARHLPFAIATDEALAWMTCMRSALEAHVPDPELRDALEMGLTRLAGHMRNREG